MLLAILQLVVRHRLIRRVSPMSFRVNFFSSLGMRIWDRSHCSNVTIFQDITISCLFSRGPGVVLGVGSRSFWFAILYFFGLTRPNRQAIGDYGPQTFHFPNFNHTYLRLSPMTNYTQEYPKRIQHHAAYARLSPIQGISDLCSGVA